MKRLRHGADVFVRTCRDALIALTVGGFLSAIVGQLCTDRVWLIATLMYLPLPVFALAVMVIDLLCSGRTVKGFRFALGVLGLVALLWQTPNLVGVSLPDPAAGTSSVRLLQWNVMWGGSFAAPNHWERIEQRILDCHADVIVLTEVPTQPGPTDQLLAKLGEGWHSVAHDYTNHDDSYWSRQRVFARYPLRLVDSRSTRFATAALVQVDAPTPWRVLIVDGISGLGDKTASLHFFADLAREYGNVDVVCGDFNAISQSHGFEALRSLGFRDASGYAGTLRPTWPSVMPVYQLDHVMLASHVYLLKTDTFYNAGTDHRGTVVDLKK